jgi:amino acid permease
MVTCELFHGFGFTPAVMVSSLAGVCTVCGQPAFTYTIGVTCPDSHRDTAPVVETH